MYVIKPTGLGESAIALFTAFTNLTLFHLNTTAREHTSSFLLVYQYRCCTDESAEPNPKLSYMNSQGGIQNTMSAVRA
jgi:hypothetical protein